MGDVIQLDDWRRRRACRRAWQRIRDGSRVRHVRAWGKVLAALSFMPTATATPRGSDGGQRE